MSQPVKIESPIFADARTMLNAVIAQTIGQMIKGDFEEGTCTLKIKIGLEESCVQNEKIYEPKIDWECSNSLKKSGKEKGSVNCLGMQLRQHWKSLCI